MGSYFAMLNRNKRSVAIDLKQPVATRALLRLIDTADVFVHNMRIGAAERLGLDYESLSKRNPRLVYACAAASAKAAASRSFRRYDDLIQGMSGIASLNAGPDGAPRYLPRVVVDKLTGQQAGLDDRHGAVPSGTHRPGQEVHVPMLETILSFTAGGTYVARHVNQPENGLGYPRMLTPHRRPVSRRRMVTSA